MPVRSHSRADFYTKTLAFVSLSGLAACAVMVDHWPSAANLPDVPFAFGDWRNPGVQIVTDVQTLASSGMTFRLDRTVAADAPRHVVHARWGASFHPRVVRAARTEPIPASLVARETAFDAVAAALPSAALSEPPDTETVDTWQPLPAPATSLASADEDGFISGAWKKTSSSVSASLDKARTSLVGAVRVVGGAFPRILKR